LQQADFDLVISDVRMPGLDGFGVFEWILKNQPHLALKFLFITGDAGSSSLNEKLESMAAPVLRKPFEIDALLLHCRDLLSKR
jgi:two-component system NtrC family sensor kinase